MGVSTVYARPLVPAERTTRTSSAKTGTSGPRVAAPVNALRARLFSLTGIVATPPVPLETCGKWTVTPAFVLRPGQPRVRRRPVRPPAAQPTQVPERGLPVPSPSRGRVKLTPAALSGSGRAPTKAASGAAQRLTAAATTSTDRATMASAHPRVLTTRLPFPGLERELARKRKRKGM